KLDRNDLAGLNAVEVHAAALVQAAGRAVKHDAQRTLVADSAKLLDRQHARERCRERGKRGRADHQVRCAHSLSQNRGRPTGGCHTDCRGKAAGAKAQWPAARLAAALFRTIRASTATPVLALIRNGLTSIEATREPASAIRLERPTSAFTA